MFVVEIPYGESADALIIRNVENGKRLTIPDDVPKPLAELIARCWDQEPAKRPSMLDVVNALVPMAAQEESKSPQGSASASGL